MESDDLTIRVLIEIRDEIRSTNERVDQTNVRVDRLGEQLTGRIDSLAEHLTGRIDSLGDRITESELRTSTAITELHGTIRDVHTLLVGRLDLRDRVERCERDIDELKRRVS